MPFQQLRTMHYPISLEEIHARVARKNDRRALKKTNGAKHPSLFEEHPAENVHETVNEFGETLVRVDGDIPVDLPIAEGDRFLFISYDQSILTHGLHKYPAKFFPELPRWLIRRFSKKGQLVLDPFAGSGTTNLESLLLHRHSVGIDVDPFSRFLARVKTTALDKEDVLAAQDEVLRRCVQFAPEKVRPTDVPIFPYRDSWFDPEITLELTYLRKTIDDLNCSQETADFLRICLSSIVRSVSNADDNCTRTVIRKRLNKIVLPSDALRRFAETVMLNVPRVIAFSERRPENVRVEFPPDMDSRSMRFPDGTFDLAVTSPPYANAVDYPRTHQLEIYWLGLAEGSLTPLKRKHVGTESVSAADYAYLHQTGHSRADVVLSQIFEKDPRRSYIAFKYLDDMRQNLREVFRVLKRGAAYIVVVGNNRIRGELFENWKYIMDLAEEVGFHVENYFGSEIIKHFIKVPREERINTDWILILRKPEVGCSAPSGSALPERKKK